MCRCQLIHLARITGYVSVGNNLSNGIAYTCRMATLARSIHIQRERNHIQLVVNVWCAVRWLQIIKFSLLCSYHPCLYSCARVCVQHGTLFNEICNMNWKWNRQQNYPVSCCGSIFWWLNRKVVDKDDDIGRSVWSRLYVLQICYGERMMVARKSNTCLFYTWRRRRHLVGFCIVLALLVLNFRASVEYIHRHIHPELVNSPSDATSWSISVFILFSSFRVPNTVAISG